MRIQGTLGHSSVCLGEGHRPIRGKQAGALALGAIFVMCVTFLCVPTAGPQADPRGWARSRWSAKSQCVCWDTRDTKDRGDRASAPLLQEGKMPRLEGPDIFSTTVHPGNQIYSDNLSGGDSRMVTGQDLGGGQ